MRFEANWTSEWSTLSPMRLLALLLATCGAALGSPPALAAADEDNGPPPGSAYPPPPPLVATPPLPPARLPVPAPQPADVESPPPSPVGFPPPPTPHPAPTAPPLLASRGSRLLWGIGLQLGYGSDPFRPNTEAPDPSNPGYGAGLYARLGDQFSDLLGLAFELGGATTLSAGYVRLASTLEVTPVDWLTVAVGPTARVDASTTSVTLPAGATLRVDYHLGVTQTASGRGALTLGLAGDVGEVVEGNAAGVAFGVYVMVGYARY
jgi:hypothetical protein